MARALHDADRGGSAFASTDLRSGADLHGGCEAAALEEVLALAGDIYDAALDPARWPETLRKLAQFVGAAAAALVSEDAVARKGGFHFSWGDDPYYTRLYYEKYI